MTFERTFIAGWADMDFNQHMANTAYLQKAADIRFMYLGENGLTPATFVERQLGPVIMTDRVDYFREFRLHDEVRVTHQCSGLSDDGVKCEFRNEFFKGDRLAARVTTLFGWVDLRARKYIAPPPDLKAVLEALERTDDFRVLD